VVGPDSWELDRDVESAVQAGLDVERRVVCSDDRGAESVPIVVVAAVWVRRRKGCSSQSIWSAGTLGPVLVRVMCCPRVLSVMLTRPFTL
jgi:hypothetical protein